MMPNNYRVGQFVLVAYDRKPTQLNRQGLHNWEVSD